MKRVLVLVVLAVAGCGGATEHRAAAPAATRTAAPTPSAPPSQAVRFKAADGQTVKGKFTPAGPHAPGVVLLHEIRGGMDQWDPLIPALHAAGYATLAYNSRMSVIERERLPDTLAAVRWLRARRDVDRRRVALVGASIGASTAVFAMATGTRRTVAAAVALSPPDSSDIWALQDHRRYHPHDLLLIADRKESTSAKSMLDGAVRSRFLQSAQSGHGVALLGDRTVRDALLAWLDERVRR